MQLYFWYRRYAQITVQLYLGTGGARCTMVQASGPYLRYGYRRSALTGTLVHSAHPYRVCCGLARLPGEIGRSPRRRWRILSLRSAAESHDQRSASPSLEGLPRRLHALSQSPQQPRWPRCTNLLLSPAQGESWREVIFVLRADLLGLSSAVEHDRLA